MDEALAVDHDQMYADADMEAESWLPSRDRHDGRAPQKTP